MTHNELVLLQFPTVIYAKDGGKFAFVGYKSGEVKAVDRQGVLWTFTGTAIDDLCAKPPLVQQSRDVWVKEHYPRGAGGVLVLQVVDARVDSFTSEEGWHRGVVQWFETAK